MCNVVLVQSNDDTKNVHVFGIWIKTLTTNGCNFFQEKKTNTYFCLLYIQYPDENDERTLICHNV